ncbi:MAG: M28 family peptidase [Gemmatimonadales bacterium]
MRQLVNRSALVIAIAGCTTATRLAAQKAAVPCPAIAIDSAGMLHDLYRLADDSMRGRRVGTPGGAKARDFIASRYDALGLDRVGAGRIQPFIRMSPDGAVNGFNVVGTIRGTTFPDRYIVVSAHFDHIGAVEPGSPCRPVGADSICNGADDNASGTAALLALAAYFREKAPTHTLLFVAFDAEELGDLGSKAWVDSPPVPLNAILIDVNMDMVGRNAKLQLYAAGPDKYPSLGPIIQQTIACSQIRLTVGHDGSGAVGTDWTDQSDQGAFDAHGIPFLYFGEEDHPDYHRATDHADRVMPGFFAAAARDAADFITRYDAGTGRQRR